MTLLSALAARPPFTWLRDLDDAIDDAWDTSDPVLRGDAPEAPRGGAPTSG